MLGAHILPALKGGDSCCQTAMSRRENVLGCIRVPVQRAFGHLGFDQLGAGYVAYENGGVALDQLRAELVQIVLALILDLGVDGASAVFLARPLRNTQLLLVAPIPAALKFLAR